MVIHSLFEPSQKLWLYKMGDIYVCNSEQLIFILICNKNGDYSINVVNHCSCIKQQVGKFVAGVKFNSLFLC